MEQNLASFKARFWAYLIDILPILFLVVFIAYFFYGFDTVCAENWNRGSYESERADFLDFRNRIRDYSFLIWLLYCILAESSVWQGTFGKRYMGIKVIGFDGNRLSFLRSLGRNSFKIVSYFVLGLGFFWVIFSKKKQGWHDKIAKTFVVNFDKPLLNDIKK